MDGSGALLHLWMTDVKSVDREWGYSLGKWLKFNWNKKPRDSNRKAVKVGRVLPCCITPGSIHIVVALVIYCCVTNLPKFSSLKQ